MNASARMDRKVAASDPALVLSQAWVEAHAQTLALCLRQQQLETELALSIGYPDTGPAVPDSNEYAVLSGKGLEDTSDLISAATGSQENPAERLSEHLAQWRAKDTELGYSAAKEAEQRAAEKEQSLLDTLATTPARTTAGVIAKLAVVLRDSEDNRDVSDFPLPLIRSILEDLTRIAAHTGPDVSKSSTVPAAPSDQPGAG